MRDIPDIASCFNIHALFAAIFLDVYFSTLDLFLQKCIDSAFIWPPYSRGFVINRRHVEIYVYAVGGSELAPGGGPKIQAEIANPGPTLEARGVIQENNCTMGDFLVAIVGLANNSNTVIQ